MPFLSIAQPAPLTAPTVALADAGAGNVNNGAHSYKVTFVTALGETDAGVVSATVTVANSAADGKVALNNIPKGDATTTARKIYRTSAGQAASGPWKLLTTIGDNTTTAYTDNTADASLGAAAPGVNTTHITVPLAEAVKRVERIGTSSRAFGGGLRSTVRAEKRTIQATTTLLLDADATRLQARLALAAQCPCAGDVLGSAGAAAFEGEVGDDRYQTAIGGDGNQFMRAIQFVLREV
jgi:hypothetical protein